LYYLEVIMNYAKVNDTSLRPYNSLKIDSIAEIMVFPFNEKGLQEIYSKYGNASKIVIMGKGSNILLSRKYYNYNYVFLNLKFMDKVELYKEKIYIEAGANLSALSWFALENNFKGFEFLEDIPGSLGGALIMNAGTYKD